MRVLVSDASILIELAKWSLLEALFQLPFEFAVPDALFEDELIDLGEVDRDRLTALGLRVESLDAEGMARRLRKARDAGLCPFTARDEALKELVALACPEQATNERTTWTTMH